MSKYECVNKLLNIYKIFIKKQKNISNNNKKLIYKVYLNKISKYQLLYTKILFY